MQLKVLLLSYLTQARCLFSRLQKGATYMQLRQLSNATFTLFSAEPQRYRDGLHIPLWNGFTLNIAFSFPYTGHFTSTVQVNNVFHRQVNSSQLNSPCWIRTSASSSQSAVPYHLAKGPHATLLCRLLNLHEDMICAQPPDSPTKTSHQRAYAIPFLIR